jgi:hypothetical protein
MLLNIITQIDTNHTNYFSNALKLSQKNIKDVLNLC